MQVSDYQILSKTSQLLDVMLIKCTETLASFHLHHLFLWLCASANQLSNATLMTRMIPHVSVVHRSSDNKHAAKVVQDIKMMRSAVSVRDKENAERATLVTQERLTKGKRTFKLQDLWIRPTFGGKGRKVAGSLEAHGNGFR